MDSHADRFCRKKGLVPVTKKLSKNLIGGEWLHYIWFNVTELGGKWTGSARVVQGDAHRLLSWELSSTSLIAAHLECMEQVLKQLPGGEDVTFMTTEQTVLEILRPGAEWKEQALLGAMGRLLPYVLGRKVFVQLSCQERQVVNGGPAEGTYSVMTDGASLSNPGPAGAGVIIRDPSGSTIREIAQHLGVATNNEAEYTALIIALEECLKMGVRNLDITTDSKLVVEQVNGNWKITAPGLAPLHRKVIDLLDRFERWSLSHVSRENNARADELSKRAAKKDL